MTRINEKNETDLPDHQYQNKEILTPVKPASTLSLNQPHRAGCKPAMVSAQVTNQYPH